MFVYFIKFFLHFPYNTEINRKWRKNKQAIPCVLSFCLFDYLLTFYRLSKENQNIVNCSDCKTLSIRFSNFLCWQGAQSKKKYICILPLEQSEIFGNNMCHCLIPFSHSKCRIHHLQIHIFPKVVWCSADIIWFYIIFFACSSFNEAQAEILHTFFKHTLPNAVLLLFGPYIQSVNLKTL